jgi:integrase
MRSLIVRIGQVAARGFASLALARGIPITDVSRWLGHKSIEVTFRIYGHLVPGSWERAREVLDAAYREGQAGL